MRVTLATAAMIIALTAPAFAEVRSRPAAKAFPFLERYWALPAAERDQFRFRYRYFLGDAPARGVSAWFVSANGARTPAVITADGSLDPTPGADKLCEKCSFEVDAPGELAVRLSFEPTAPLAQEYEAATLAAALKQAQAGAKKAAGVMAFAAPKFERVYFVDVAEGYAVGAGGQRIPLPIQTGESAGAQRIVLAKAPSRLAMPSRKD